MLTAAREKFPKRRIIVAFEPHLYSRTKLLFNDLTASFNLADEILILPIYAAREKPDPSITSQMLAAAINARGQSAKYYSNFATAKKYLANHLHHHNVFLTMGAGNIFALAQKLRYNQSTT